MMVRKLVLLYYVAITTVIYSKSYDNNVSESHIIDERCSQETIELSVSGLQGDKHKVPKVVSGIGVAILIGHLMLPRTKQSNPAPAITPENIIPPEPASSENINLDHVFDAEPISDLDVYKPNPHTNNVNPITYTTSKQPPLNKPTKKYKQTKNIPSRKSDETDTYFHNTFVKLLTEFKNNCHSMYEFITQNWMRIYYTNYLDVIDKSEGDIKTKIQIDNMDCICIELPLPVEKILNLAELELNSLKKYRIADNNNISLPIDFQGEILTKKNDFKDANSRHVLQNNETFKTTWTDFLTKVYQVKEHNLFFDIIEESVNVMSFRIFQIPGYTATIPTALSPDIHTFTVNNYGGSGGKSDNQCGLAAFINGITEKLFFLIYNAQNRYKYVTQEQSQQFCDVYINYIYNTIINTDINSNKDKINLRQKQYDKQKKELEEQQESNKEKLQAFKKQQESDKEKLQAFKKEQESDKEKLQAFKKEQESDKKKLQVLQQQQKREMQILNNLNERKESDRKELQKFKNQPLNQLNWTELVNINDETNDTTYITIYCYMERLYNLLDWYIYSSYNSEDQIAPGEQLDIVMKLSNLLADLSTRYQCHASMSASGDTGYGDSNVAIPIFTQCNDEILTEPLLHIVVYREGHGAMRDGCGHFVNKLKFYSKECANYIYNQFNKYIKWLTSNDVRPSRVQEHSGALLLKPIISSPLHTE